MASVVIIGAGVAGLSAATSLCSGDTDFKVTLLEASNQVGGRTRSVAMGSGMVDLGATAMYYSSSREEGDSLVEYAMSRGLVKETVEAGHIQRSQHHKPSLYLLSSGERVSSKRVAHYKEAYYQARSCLLKQVERDGDSLSETTSTLESGKSLNDGITKHYYSVLHSSRGCKREEAKGGSSSITAGWGAGHVLDYMLRGEGISNGAKLNEDVDLASYCDFQDEDKHCVLREGYQSVALQLAEELPPHCLILNKEVKTVLWSADPQTSAGTQATITCSDGSTFTADHVIITVSLGVLKRKCVEQSDNSVLKTKQLHDVPFFKPPLPKEKLEAIHRLGFGTISKVLVQFPKPLAHENGDLELLWLEKDYSFPKSHSWASRQAYVTRYDDSSIYETWFVGEDSFCVDSQSDHAVMEGITLVAEKFLGRTLVRPKKIAREKWSLSPHFLGAYSFNEIGSGRAEREALSKPVGGRASLQLLFAGEATHSTLFSTVNGAYESGVREALRLKIHYSSEHTYTQV